MEKGKITKRGEDNHATNFHKWEKSIVEKGKAVFMYIPLLCFC